MKNHNQNCKCCSSRAEPKKVPALDTLAQLGIFSEKQAKNPDNSDFEKVTKINDLKTLRKRAGRKYITSALAKGLILINECEKEIQLEQLARQTKRNRIKTTIKYTSQANKRIKIKPLSNYSVTPNGHDDIQETSIDTEQEALSFIYDIFYNPTFISKKRPIQLKNAPIEQQKEIDKRILSKINVDNRLDSFLISPTESPNPEQRFLDIFYKTSDSNSVERKRFSKNNKKLDFFEVEAKDKKIIQSYWNMYHCNREMIVSNDGTVSTRYCKNRLCMTCNAIRTAELINTYAPVLESWKNEMYMVTLTVENCTQSQLKQTIDEMQKVFVKVKDSLKKRFSDGHINEKFAGIRKLECTSIRENDFHPHYHILVKGKENALELREQWVKIVEKSKVISCKMKGTDKFGNEVYLQDVTKADEQAGKELFKYFTKILSKNKNDENIYLHRLDTIFKAIRGKRVFQTFGFKISDYTTTIAEQKTDNQEQVQEIEKDVFKFSLLDSTQQLVNEAYELYAKTNHNAENKIDLVKTLYNIQKDKIMSFLPYMNDFDKSSLEFIMNDFEQSQKNMIDLDCFQIELEKINQDLVISLQNVEDGEQDTDEKSYKVFIYNEVSKMWHSIENGEPLFYYTVSAKSSETVKRMKYPKKYRDKIVDIFINYDTYY